MVVDKMFTSFNIGGCTVKNRLVLSPMTNNQSNPDGSVSESDLIWYERAAKDGIGMVITAACAISRQSIGWINQINAGSDKMLPGLTKLANRLKPYSSVNLVQLCHAGSRSDTRENGGVAYSASSYNLPGVPGFVPPQALTTKEVYKVIEDFADACHRVYQAGFDGIEIHGANGYIVTQFISTMSNLRHDEFGGSLENRAFLAREIVRQCRKKVPESFIIGMRLTFENSGMETGLDIDENIQVAKWLVKDGINYLHVSNLDYKTKSLKYNPQSTLNYICKNFSEIPIMAVGGITNAQTITEILDQGSDMVALGRIIIGNPNFVHSLKDKNIAVTNPPYPVEHLTKLGLDSRFINYVQNDLKVLNIVLPT